MFWTDDTAAKNEFVIPDNIVDISFKLECKVLPLDHAWSLSQALLQALPWLAEDEQAGVHLIHVAESGNGWHRPDDPENDVLYLSKRTRMTLRIPKDQIDAAHTLTGKTLNIDGSVLTVGEGSIKLLSNLPTLFARYVVTDSAMDEQHFLSRAANQLKAMGIPVLKLMAGKQTQFRLPQGPITTRSLMVADLTPAHSVRLQQQGLGIGRKYGCGLFLPQKGINSLKSDAE
jgi:CRISPR-associated protein Cas6